MDAESRKLRVLHSEAVDMNEKRSEDGTAYGVRRKETLYAVRRSAVRRTRPSVFPLLARQAEKLHVAAVEIENRRRRGAVEPPAPFTGIDDQRFTARFHLLL